MIDKLTTLNHGHIHCIDGIFLFHSFPLSLPYCLAYGHLPRRFRRSVAQHI